jgi:hypothetical protein
MLGDYWYLWIGHTFVTLKKDLILILGHCHLLKEWQSVQCMAVAQCRIFMHQGHWQISSTNSEATLAGLDQEPTWLKNCHQSLEEETPHEPEVDQDEMANVSDFVLL